jgi:hypothetical protein
LGHFQNKNRLVQRFPLLSKTFFGSQPLEDVKVETSKLAHVVQLLVEGLTHTVEFQDTSETAIEKTAEISLKTIENH